LEVDSSVSFHLFPLLVFWGGKKKKGGKKGNRRKDVDESKMKESRVVKDGRIDERRSGSRRVKYERKWRGKDETK